MGEGRKSERTKKSKSSSSPQRFLSLGHIKTDVRID